MLKFTFGTCALKFWEGYMPRKYFRLIIRNFSFLNTYFDHINDPRNPKLITYNLTTLVWYVMLGFCLKLGSNRALYFNIYSEQIPLLNFRFLTADSQLNKIPHYDTPKYLMKKLSPLELEKTGAKLANELIRKKTFDKYRLFGKYFTIALDGTQYYKSSNIHCPWCLHSTHKNQDKDGNECKRTYFHHNLLTARFIFPNGITLPIATEFIENDSKRNYNCRINFSGHPPFKLSHHLRMSDGKV